MIEELAEFLDKNGESSALIRREATAGDLLQAASYGFSKLTLSAMSEFVRKAVRLGSAKPCEIHKAIVELGPTCYVTTNYDDLIEQALAEWQPDAFYPAPITNRHLAEIADILGARSSHFIFKPHGTATDAASIVLTREQYRVLLPDGERHRALEAVKTLLLTRPFLYLGFGLRDPDFLYLRDLLLNTFQGATRDHYAIMPDVSHDETDYWRRQYGIHLVGYQTYPRSDGSRDHRELLEMLRSLAAGGIAAPHHSARVANPPVAETRPSHAERVLALTRYTAGLLRLVPPKEPIEIRVHSPRLNRRSFAPFDPFENWTATHFLTKGPSSALLIGLPGAGKSFALRVATSHLAQTIQQACLDDTVDTSNLALPVLIDLKLYQGDLRAQIDAALPAGFSLENLLGKLRLRLFLDAYNEMPSVYLEDGSILKSVDSLRDEVGEFDYVITSRTTDGLPTQGLPHYELAWFDSEYVEQALAEHSIILSGHFKADILMLLSRPFFLRLVISGSVKVPQGARPNDIYASYIHNLQSDFAERFSINMPLVTALSRVAYRALDDEREAFPLNWLTDQLLMIGDELSASTQDVVNWLIARGTLLPYSGGRASFIHQSITEYCAALELVRLHEAQAFSLRDTVALKKWDQCLFLALGMMDSSEAGEILAFLMRTDLGLAFRAVRYADDGQSEAITKLLTILVEGAPEAEPLLLMSLSFSHLPLGTEHVPYLEEMLKFGGSLAGEAVQALATIVGPSYKPTLLELLDREKTDFNFSVNGIARALAPLLDVSDLPHLLDISVAAAALPKDEHAGAAVADLLACFEPDLLLATARAHAGSPLPPNLVEIVCDALKDRRDKRSFEILADFVLEGYTEAIAALYFRIPYDEFEAGELLGGLAVEHVRALWRGRASTGPWWYKILHKLCRMRPQFAKEAALIASHAEDIERIALLFCLDTAPMTIHRDLERLASSSDMELMRQSFEMFRLADLDWTGTGSLYPRLLARDIEPLRRSLLDGSSMPDIKGLGQFGPDVLIPVAKVAAALSEEEHWGEEHWWVKRQLGSIVARHGDPDVRGYLLDQLAHGDVQVRSWVKVHVLAQMDGVSTDEMSDDAIAFLLADLPRSGALNELLNNALGHIASERFVSERLIPLARGASETLLKNLRIVLNAAGDRHGRRYLLPN